MLATFVLLTIGLALLFDFINGFHDSANAIATVVATRVLKPFQAVIMAGFFNFLGPFVFSLAVANTVGKGIITAASVDSLVIFGALAGATVWDLVTWWLGLPTSSSHALVGGLIGAAWAAAGTGAILLPTNKEFADMAVILLKGGIGGLAVGLVFLVLSLVRLPRHFLWPLAFLGLLGMGYIAIPAGGNFAHFPKTLVGGLQGIRDLGKPILVSLVYLVIGALAGALLWAGTQKRLAIRNLPFFILPGAFGYLATATLLGNVHLGGLTKVIVFMFVSPVLGFYMGFLVTAAFQWIWRDTSAARVNHLSRRLQLGSSAFYALTHGTNDAQKTMGVIGVLLVSVGAIGLNPDKTLALPVWVILACAAAMGLGTAFGGWRIVKTMASRITHLEPHQGFAAEMGGGVVLVAMAESGIPVSTTHAISSSIMGVGATKRASAVRWNVGRQMFIAWIVTIPAAAVVAAITYYALLAATKLLGH